MALISLRQLLDHAAEHGYGVPAFNVNNLEQIQAIMQAAAKTDSPVILQASAGARKYAPRAWEVGMDWSRCFSALQRHAWKWQAGEEYDPETGAHHMTAAAWNAMALFVYEARNVGKDDRP